MEKNASSWSSSSSWQLEVTIISAEDLRIHHRSIKKNAFVTVKSDYSATIVSTSIDNQGGSYPSWNEKLDFSMPCNVKFISVEVQCKIGTGTRIIGTARIPVSDFIGDYIPPHYLHFLSYRLRDCNGQRNGIINLSVRVKGSDYVDPPSMKLGANKCDSSSSYCGDRGAPKISGGIAMGIPVSYGCSV